MRIAPFVGAVAIAATAAITVAPPAHALGPGRACIFLQPAGAPVLGDNRGHVGWGYRIGDSDQYIFGATENPSGAYHIAAGKNAGMWTAQGTWSQMLNAFRNQPYFPVVSGGPPRPYNAYTKYKCYDTPTSSVTAANNEVNVVKAAGYDGLGNNCMNHAYRILKAYGTPSLQDPDDIANWEPRSWYANHTTGWWESQLGSWWHNPFTGLAMDLSGMSASDGAYLQTWEVNSTNAQHWVSLPQGDGWVSIHNVHSGKCVDVDHARFENFVKVWQWGCNRNTNQLWRFEHTGKYFGGYPVYRIRVKHSNKCLDIERQNPNPGTHLIQYDCNTLWNQEWF
jgi:Ricin-type beta-trefoil lectin domain-like